MKAFQNNFGKLLILVVACGFAASDTTEAGAFSSSSVPSNGAAFTDNARLIVRREADFGTIIYLNLYIDGVQVTLLGYNQRYEAIVRPGQHVLSVATTPSPHGKTKVNHRQVTFKRGETYEFTALWEDADHAVLETSDMANQARRIWY